ncbi:hypothetical protein GCM10008995_15940 [Halobellus salinus]|uniref:histidine kinase n=1 Tax=Halobellus salinus TaxID=931585 RepID=A0A830ENS7_9EURY|nr:hypothetical protein GCM10008995_15940 [Halobellus salinus]
MRVLLVGGGAVTKERLEAALAVTASHPVVTRIRSGRGALSAVEDGMYDAVVATDGLVGDLDAAELVCRVRGGRNGSIPFVFVSGSTATDAIDDAIDRGADRCLLRGYSPAWYRTLANAVVSTVENRWTRARLERTTDDLQQIYDTVPTMITRKDTQNRLLRVNNAVTEYLDRPREEIEGATAWELFPDHGEEFYEVDRRVIESGAAVRGDVCRLSTPSGRERWMKTDAIPYRGDDGEIEGVLVVSEDITRVKARERQLERQNERLDRFTSVVSHDLRNPLNVAMGRVELARRECDSDHLVTAEAAHARMYTLIRNLLQLAREGTPVAEPEPVGLCGLVDACWAGVETGDADLRNEASRWIEGDADRLQQVFENLFRNSVEHSSTGSRTESDDAVEHGPTGSRSDPHGNSVEHGSTSNRAKPGDSVEHGSTGSHAQPDDAIGRGGDAVTITVGEFNDGIYVADNGSGIPVDEREAVFETGYSGSEGGTGFGLSIVAEIVEAHGWGIRVTDGADGGARFEITGVEFVGPEAR